VDGATWEGDPDAAVLHDLAPSGVMRVAFNYNNRNNAARDPITGALSGPGIDMSCKLAQGTHVPFVAIAYLGVPPLLGGLANSDWDAAFAFDQTLEPPGITAAIPHIGVAEHQRRIVGMHTKPYRTHLTECANQSNEFAKRL